MAETGRLAHYLFCVLLFYTIVRINGDVIPAEVEVIVTVETKNPRDSSGSPVFAAESEQTILLVGRNFTNETAIAFTKRPSEKGERCEQHGQLSSSHSIDTSNPHDNANRGVFKVVFDTLTAEGEYYYICVKAEDGARVSWIHQGDDPFVRFSVVEPSTTFMPLGIQITCIVLLLCLSGLFSGLNLGLMSLDKTELKIIEKCGSKSEKQYAKVISPVRKRGNFLLCTLLLGNVLVNNSLTILLDNITNGLIAVIGATAFIVIFGEIVPQAICSRHGLAVGARTRFITYFFMILTFPLSFPISLILDKILGEEIGQVYNREKLQELIKVTKDFSALDEDEMNIISGALTLTKKTVRDIMTRIDDVYLLDYNDILNFETMSEIMKRGYSRIPVYENDKGNIVALLNIKDLALIDPDDNTPLKTVCKFYQHHLIFVFDDHKLDQMLQDFRQGHSHMAIVRRVNNEGPGDPYYETLGVVTLEDVIEEIIQSEIIDETDTLTDNIKKAPRMLPRQDFSVFNQPDHDNKHALTPQLTVAAFQFLSTSVEPFSPKYISDAVLRKLIKQNIVVEMNPENTDHAYIYKEGVPCDYFVIILQGHVEVKIGRENLQFQGGPFSYYGTNALDVNDQILAPTSTSDSIYIKHNPYIPDFTVKATDSVLFLRIKRPHYIVARRATMMGRATQAGNIEEEVFSKEWLHLSKINQCNSSNNQYSVDVHKVDEKPPYSSNWTPVTSSNNITTMVKRVDSKDSGWNFSGSEKPEGTSGSDLEHIELTSRDTDQLTPKTCEDNANTGMNLESSDHSRTSNSENKDGGAVVTMNTTRSCDSSDFSAEEQGSGEFTPLMKKESPLASQPGGDF